MRKVYLTFLLGLFLVLGLSFIHFDSSSSLASPILGITKTRIADNLWLPGDVYAQDLNSPQISSRAAFFIETNTGKVLFTKNIHERLSIASLVKIMTVIISLESKKFNDSISISPRAAQTEPDKMLLIAGERLTVEELLDGIFLVSANDAAEALSEEATGSREEFITLMNQKARQLGMKETFFLNPTGLEEEGEQQYSSAYDVAIMARYAIKNWPQLVDISSTEHIFIDKTDYHQDYDLYSGINLLTTYPGVVGFKTGFTPEAGLTLVTLARREGREVLGVLLGSTDRRVDAKELLDYSFKKLGVNQ